MTRLQEHIDRDVAYLNDVNEWAHWPFCPVKRYDGKDKSGFPTCGVVVSTEDHPIPFVTEVNLFFLPGMTHEEFKSLPRHEYDTIEELVADGWMVD